MIEVPSMKFDILVGLESILGKLILVDLLGASLPAWFLISREDGFGSFLSLLTPVLTGFCLPAWTRWDPPGGGLGSILPVPVPAPYLPLRSGTGVLRACRDSDLAADLYFKIYIIKCPSPPPPFSGPLIILFCLLPIVTLLDHSRANRWFCCC